MKYYKYSFDMKKLNFLCIILFVPIIIYIIYYRYSNYLDLNFVILYIFWLFLHELFHGIGFSLNKQVDNKKIVYGASLENGILYCMCKQVISKKSIIVSLLFPFFFLGVFTFFLGIFINSPLLILLSLFNIDGCVGDLAMFFAFLKLPDFNYLDLDECTEFVLVSKNDLSKYKLFGLDLKEKGDYDKLKFAKNFKKLSFSRLSAIIFILLFIVFIINLFV